MLEEGLLGVAFLKGPGSPAWGDASVLPKLWSVLKEGLRGVVLPKCPGSAARGDGESCPGCGRCSRRSCGGQQFPTARAHHPGGTGSPVQAVVRAQGGRAGDGSSQWPGIAILKGREVLPRPWSVLKECLRWVAIPNGPGSSAWGDGESYPGGCRC